MKKRLLLFIGLASILTLTGCAKWIDRGESITAVGSSALQPLVETASEEYQSQNPGRFINVQGGGSGTGLSQVQSGAVDIGNSDLFAEEKKGIKAEDLIDHKVAVVGITPIVNKNVGVKDISMENLKKIFLGEVTNWKDLGGSDEPIVVVGREAGSGTRGAFEELLGLEGACQYANELDSTGAVIAKVASTPGAIGYASLDAVDDTIIAAKLNGVEPTEENIKAGSYILSRPFVMATMGEVSAQSEPVQALFDYLKSDEGKQLIQSVGLITVD